MKKILVFAHHLEAREPKFNAIEFTKASRGSHCFDRRRAFIMLAYFVFIRAYCELPKVFYE